MKLSNKILIGFFGFALIYMLAAFTEIRFRGDYEGLDSDKAITETLPLPTIGYLVVPDLGRRIEIRSSDEAGIEIISNTGEVLSGLQYNVRGDTLTLEALNLPDEGRFRVAVLVPKEEFRGLKTDETSVFINYLRQSTFSLDLSGGRVTMNGDINFEKLNITATEDANFDARISDVDTANLSIDRANIGLRARVGRLEGSMINESELRVQNPSDIQFKKDDSSRLWWLN